MTITVNLGYPRIGPHREFKRAVEAYWHNKIGEADLLRVCRDIRRQNWLAQQQAHIQHIPSNDFSLYDHVLDTVAMVGAVPPRFGWTQDTIDLPTMFAMGRGLAERNVPAMEMTKWFDTNYHYIVPEFWPDQTFRLASTKPIDEFLEAQVLGIHTRPVLLGPLSFLLLGKAEPGFDPLSLLDRLLPVYERVLRQLAQAGADWVQLDEPVLSLDLGDAVLRHFQDAYARLGTVDHRLLLCLTTYFGELGRNLLTAVSLPVDALHLDLVRAPHELDTALQIFPADMSLSLGVVDGRNVWRTDLAQAISLVERAAHHLGRQRIMVGPSCSLMFSPLDIEMEKNLDAEIRPWLAFARQKLDEIAFLGQHIGDDLTAIPEFRQNQAAMQARRISLRAHHPQVQGRLAAVTPDMARRATPFAARKAAQQAHLHLPLLPTTTIGSFPQTDEIRQARQNWRKGVITQEAYEHFLQKEIGRVVRFQEEIGLDVLVHGEPERTDMVEYFGEQLAGFLITEHGWVQSYGSRCVRPPIIYGDVYRPHPMTVRWAQYAQSCTARPMKGMLTGPVTILEWSFVRDDQPRAQTCRQIALALRDEVNDLQAADIRVIQIDEPALREGLPLRRRDWEAYLTWATESFRLAASGVDDATQIHTHMCYSEFNDMIEWIAALDADVISIESSRSRMDLLGAFVRYAYPNDVGPGVYDIHSPRVPAVDEIADLLRKALQVLLADRLWVNPDCGLKTRRWAEVRPALMNMVQAAETLRADLLAGPSE